LLKGQGLTLTELAAHPLKSTLSAVDRSLSCPLPSCDNLGLVFADGLAPPVAPESFDTVITPWFVDQVPKDAAQIPPLVSRLLRDGGSYICTGPFLYDVGHTLPSHRYCADEYVELVRTSGFSVTRASYAPESYVASPASTQGRSEHVLYLHARKAKEVHATSEANVPSWLRTGTGALLPVPQPEIAPSLEGTPREVSEVFALIDGTRSVSEIGRVLVERKILVDDETTETVVRACLKIIFRKT
jgi:hypothetical protein